MLPNSIRSRWSRAPCENWVLTHGGSVCRSQPPLEAEIQHPRKPAHSRRRQQIAHRIDLPIGAAALIVTIGYIGRVRPKQHLATRERNSTGDAHVRREVTSPTVGIADTNIKQRWLTASRSHIGSRRPGPGTVLSHHHSRRRQPMLPSELGIECMHLIPTAQYILGAQIVG